MKKLVFVISIVTILCGCQTNYKICYKMFGHKFVPDSNKVKVENYVKNVVSAASFHMSTADYEEPEDLIRQARYDAENLYSIDVPKLCNERNDGIEYDQMTKEQTLILDSLIRIRDMNINRAMRK